MFFFLFFLSSVGQIVTPNQLKIDKFGQSKKPFPLSCTHYVGKCTCDLNDVGDCDYIDIDLDRTLNNELVPISNCDDDKNRKKIIIAHRSNRRISERLLKKKFEKYRP